MQSETCKMLIAVLLSVCVLGALGDETTMPTITSATKSSSLDNEQELQTEETRVLKKPENSTLPANHSETLRAMPTQVTKTVHPDKDKSGDKSMIQTSQSQRQSHNVISPPTVLNITAVTDVGKLKDFRPSPQLEPIYEYNHFPVVPAHPEAKFFQTSIKIPIHSTLSHVQENDDQDESDKDIWTSNVRFPNSQPITVNDHPYPYMKDSQVGKGLTTGFGLGLGYHKDIPSVMKRPIMHKHSIFGGESWEKTLKKKPPSKSYHEHEHEHEHGHEHGGGGFGGFTDLTSSPWKKIIKILTAFIPIGLLLSALTPSIITIGPVNGTYGRARSGDKPKNTLLSHLALDGCDERIFCELMLSAEESGNNDKNIETMLQNFVESHGDATRLKLIYKAIKSGNCSTLHCNSIKD